MIEKKDLLLSLKTWGDPATISQVWLPHQKPQGFWLLPLGPVFGSPQEVYWRNDLTPLIRCFSLPSLCKSLEGGLYLILKYSPKSQDGPTPLRARLPLSQPVWVGHIPQWGQPVYQQNHTSEHSRPGEASRETKGQPRHGRKSWSFI